MGKKLISRKKAKSHYRKYFVIPVVEWNSISLIVLPTYYIYTCTDWFSLITSKFWGTHKTFVIFKTVKSIQNTEQNAFLPHLHVNDKKKNKYYSSELKRDNLLCLLEPSKNNSNSYNCFQFFQKMIHILIDFFKKQQIIKNLICGTGTLWKQIMKKTTLSRFI